MSVTAIALSLAKLATLFGNKRALAVFAAASAKLAVSGTALAAAYAVGGKLDEAQKAFFDSFIDLIAGLGSNLAATEIDKALSQLDPAQLDHANQHFVRFTGCVIEALLRQVLADKTFNLLPTQRTAVVTERETLRDRLLRALPQVPGQWLQFIQHQPEGAQPLAHADFVKELRIIQLAQATGPAIPPAVLSSFLKHWLPSVLTGESDPAILVAELAQTIAPRVGHALTDAIATDDPNARAALAKALLHNQAEFSVLLIEIKDSLTGLHGKTDRIEHNQLVTAVRTEQHHQDEMEQFRQLFSFLDTRLGPAADPKAEQARIEALIAERSGPARLEAYRRSLRFAFSRYEELALDHIAAADAESPSILDIFVHPACHPGHLRPEDIDADERHRHGHPDGKALAKPTQDLIPLLAQDDHRRTVLLADPGMGKSTLIQSLIAHLASGQPIEGAHQLNGHLPVPFILRDLVHHLPQDQVEKWDWQSLVTAFLSSYARVPDAPPLCAAYQSEPEEFHTLITTNPKVFFLIDGLDEIGDLRKRKQVVKAIQEGIRSASPEARWLITSRVIGYDEARVEIVFLESSRSLEPFLEEHQLDEVTNRSVAEFRERIKWLWGSFILDGPALHGLPKPGEPRRYYANDYPTTVSVGFGHLDREGEDEYLLLHASTVVAQRLYLAPFDDARQEAFSQRWFQKRSTHDYSKELLTEVRGGYQDGVRIIARVPNLLCMMNMLKRSGKQLPDGRHSLYAEITHYYLGGLEQAYRQKKILGLDCPFAPAERHRLLALLGAHMQHQRTAGAQEPKNDSILISRPTIHTLLVPVIQSLQDQRKVPAEHSAADLLDELLQHIASRSGLLIPRSVDDQGEAEFAFTHLSFLEYFCASHLCQQLEYQEAMDGAELKAIKAKRLFDPAAYERQYPRGPHPIQPSDFAALAAQPLWHEVLILLMEAHSVTTATQQRDALLENLFPPLYAVEDANPQPSQPLLPLPAVELAVKLAHDRDLALPDSTRQHWWRTLWSASLRWPHPPWHPGESMRWPIAPLLLERSEHRPEILQTLNLMVQAHPGKPLYLNGCNQLTSRDLPHLDGLDKLEGLYLDGCTGLRSTQGLPPLPALKTLGLGNCTGLEGADALQGLAGLDKLEELYLNGCTGLRSTQGLPHLPALKKLYLRYCTNLKGEGALQGLAGLNKLDALHLYGCPDLTEDNIGRLRDQIGGHCNIVWP